MMFFDFGGHDNLELLIRSMRILYQKRETNSSFKTFMSSTGSYHTICNQCDMKLIINRPFGITQFQNMRLSNSHVINVN